MPRLSDSMEEGTILTWNVAVGDEVEVGQEIAEIETDKANMGYESDVAGTVLEILVPEGETAAVGAIIAVIGEPDAERQSARPAGPVADGDTSSSRDDAAGDVSPSAPPAGGADALTASGSTAPESSSNGAGSASGTERVKASPVARRLAVELGVDLGALIGSGPGGRIVKRDVEGAPAQAVTPPTPTQQVGVGGVTAAAAAAPSEAAAETAKGATAVVELTKLQQVVARRMAESKATAPDFALSRELDMDAAVALRASLKDWSPSGGVNPSVNDLVVKACALALRDHPRANGSYKDGHWELYERVNVGIAVAASDGALIVPVVNDADRASLGQIARESRRLAVAAREGTVTPPELSGGTFTVSNLGMFGIDNFTAVINPPQAAILAVGALAQKPVVIDGELAVGWRMGVTLVCDHRILSGADGAAFLGRVAELLASPGALVL